MFALSTRNKMIKWWNKNNSISSLPLEDETLFGIIVNQYITQLSGFRKSRHWFAISKVQGSFYNSNSSLMSPMKFVSNEELMFFLKKEIELGGEIILVLNETVKRSEN